MIKSSLYGMTDGYVSVVMLQVDFKGCFPYSVLTSGGAVQPQLGLSTLKDALDVWPNR